MCPRALVEQIALYLGTPWKFNRLREQSKWRFEIIDGAGKALIFRPDKDRLKIFGSFPPSITSPHHSDYKTIGVSMSRNPKDCARDISRRLIPHYTEAFERAMEQYREDKAQEQRISHIAQLILKASKGNYIGLGKRNPSIYFNQGNARIWTDESITLELKNLSVTKAIQILSLLLDHD